MCLYVITNMVLQSTFSVMNFCMKDFKTGCETHWNILTFVAYTLLAGLAQYACSDAFVVE